MDSMLDSRLSVLEESLKRAEDPADWKTKLELRNVTVEDRVWIGTVMAIQREVGMQLRELRSIRTDMLADKDPATQWARYDRVYRVSQGIFRECLELIGGLALRDKLLDDQICQLTDELITACADSMLRPPSLSVPAEHEIFSRTLGRVIRMRFPEWTIWTLPLAAHEYGHVVIDDTKSFSEYTKSRAEQLTGNTFDGVADGPANLAVLQRTEQELRILLADAFATYTMGPAYAAAAILIRFNPLAARDEGGQLSDAARAELVLGVLEAMGAGVGEKNPYGTAVSRLRACWDDTVATTRAGAPLPTHPLVPADVLRLLTDELGFLNVGFPIGSYGDNATGWAVASNWSQQWTNQMDRLDRLTLPAVSPNNKLRDALNAAWHCRLESPAGQLAEIEQIARSLCDAVMESRQQKGRSRAGGNRPNAQRPRGDHR